MYKILAVDDEHDVCSLLKDFFEIKGYEVYLAENAKSALKLIKNSPDIILLDINMPEVDGLTLCRMIREAYNGPILFLTARCEDSDKISGFAAGGDDYIVKPFSMSELEARVMAHIRRDHREKERTNVRYFGKVSVDYNKKTVSAGGEQILFTRTEYEIIELLSLNKGQVFDKERIYEKIKGYDAVGNDTVIAEHIRKIRKKLSDVNEDTHIETVWGMGYRWI